MYKHKDVEDYVADAVGATGLKLRIDSFMLDLHQRREEFASQGKGRLKVTKTSGMRINKAQLDFISADIRAVSATIKGTAMEDLQHATDEELASFHDQIFVSPDVSRFTIPDHDTQWIDMDDFVELDWILPAETHPETKIMPLAVAPRFTYFRQTDHEGSAQTVADRSSPFGNEPTHYCVMTDDNDPQRVQRDLVQGRIDALQEQLQHHRNMIREQESKVNSCSSGGDIRGHDQQGFLEQQCSVIEQRLLFMRSMLKQIRQHLKETHEADKSFLSLHENQDVKDLPVTTDESVKVSQEHLSQPIELASDFNNRFIVHNIHLKWNNSLRNIILRYVHQVSQRRGFVYYMSRRAVKFILDIVEEQRRNKERLHTSPPQHTPSAQPSPSISFGEDGNDFNLEERIRELLNDGKSFVDANDPKPALKSPIHATASIKGDLSEEFTAQNSYHVRLIAPQIQLQSEKNSKSVLLVTTKEMQLKVIQIMDRNRLADNVSGLVQHRFSVDMDGVQFFVTNQKVFTKFVQFHSANRYGTPKGSAWPPWAPVEVNFDFQLNPPGWYRVVQKTSASLRYDKYNTLRLKYNDEVSKNDRNGSTTVEDPESRIDHLWVEFPHIRAICDSTQYYAMYVIVLDLLLYSEPLEKIRSERLEKIMLAADFSDLTGAPEMVTSLQERIRQLEEIKLHFQLHAKDLDRQGWRDRLAIEHDLTSCEDELFFMMKAITTSQRKYDERAQDSQTNGLLRWYLSASEIVWHLMRDNDEPLMEIQLQHATYDRTDNSDGSNHNAMEIERIHGLNLLPDATYPEMLAPYFEPEQNPSGQHESIKMFKVQWNMLEAIAGIPVLDQFEVNLFPIKVQLEREVGKRLFEYIFPGNGSNGGASPFLLKHAVSSQDEEDISDDGADVSAIPKLNDMEISEPQSGHKSSPLELRLRPTLSLPNTAPNTGLASLKSKHLRLSTTGENSRFKIFSNTTRSKSASRSSSSTNIHATRSLSQRRSGESSLSQDHLNTGGSATNLSTITSSSERSRKLASYRSNSTEKIKDEPIDELTEMMSRASNYMTLAYAKVPSVVLCLSYKGRGERNIEDVHDFVFRMPTLEYRNKTWSNLDLALRLKKDVTKALLSHTGAIISNKLSHHRPTKHQQSRLREIANSSSLLPNTNSLNNAVSRTSTTAHNRSTSRDRREAPPTTAFIAGWGTSITKTRSEISDLEDSMISPGNTTGFASVKTGNLTKITSQHHNTPSDRPSPVPSSSNISEDVSEDADFLTMQKRDRSVDSSRVQKRERSSTIRPRSQTSSPGDGDGIEAK